MNEPTPMRNAAWGEKTPSSIQELFFSFQQRLDSMDEKLDGRFDSINKTLGDGSTNFATIEIRLKILELVVYSGIGLVLTGVLGALLFLVIKSGSVP